MNSIDIDTLPYRDCVGLCLINRDGAIWAGERIDTPGAWQMPQGGIDKGETSRDAALRELGEETSLPPDAVEIAAEVDGWINYDLPVDLIPRLWNGKYRGQRQKWFLLQLMGSDDLVNIATSHPEFSAWSWLGRNALLERIVPFKQNVYARVFDAFSEHLKA